MREGGDRRSHSKDRGNSAPKTNKTGSPLDSSGYSTKSATKDAASARDSPFSRLDPPSALRKGADGKADSRKRSSSSPKPSRTGSPRRSRDESPGTPRSARTAELRKEAKTIAAESRPTTKSKASTASSAKRRPRDTSKSLDESAHSVGTSASRTGPVDSPRRKTKGLDESSHSVGTASSKNRQSNSTGSSAAVRRSSRLIDSSKSLDTSSHSVGSTSSKFKKNEKGGLSSSKNQWQSPYGSKNAVNASLEASMTSIGSNLEVESAGTSFHSSGRSLDASLRSLVKTASSSSQSTTSTLETPLIRPGVSKASSSSKCRMKLEQSDNVLVVTATRRQPTMHLPAPHVYIAAGTESGVVAITRLKASASLTGVSYRGISDNLKSKPLGNTISARRGGSVRSIDFSPDGRFMAVGGDDGCCCIYNLEYSEDKEKDKLTGIEICVELTRSDRIYSVQFSPDGKYLAIGGFDEFVAIVEVPSLETQCPEILREIPSEGKVFALDWCSNSRYLAFGGSDKCCSIVDVESWRIVEQFRRPASIQAIKWSPHGGAVLAVGSTDVAIVDRESLTIKSEIDLRTKSTVSYLARIMVNTLCWSPNGYVLVVGTSDNRCSFVEIKTGKTVKEVPRSSEITSVCWGEQSVLGDAPRRYMAVFPRRLPADAMIDEEVRAFDLGRVTVDDRT